MRISKRNLAIDQADDSEDCVRPTLATICFEHEGSVSADGIRLALVPYPEACAEDDAAIGTLIPIDIARRAAKAARWRDEIHLERDGDNFAITIRQRLDDGSPERVDVRLTGEVAKPTVAYPNWRNIVPPESGITAEAAVNPKYLIEACKRLHEAGYTAVRLRLSDQHKPLIVEGVEIGSANNAGAFLLVMPMKVVNRTDGLTVVKGGKVGD